MKPKMTIADYSKIFTSLDETIRRLEKDFVRLLSLKAMCIEMGENKDLYEVASNKLGTKGLNIVTSTVTESLISCLIRIFDNKSNGCASLKALRKIFSTYPWLVESLSDDAREWPADQSEMVKGKLLQGLEKIDLLLAHDETVNKLEAVREFRHYEIGHALLGERTKEIKYHYLYDLVDILHPIITDFYLCITGISTDHKEWEESFQEQSIGFVETLTEGFKKLE